MKIGYYVTPLLKHQQFELDFGNFGTIALTREAVVELIQNLKSALEEHPAAQKEEIIDEKTYVPFMNCGHKNSEDGCCMHLGNATPECHQFICPIQAAHTDKQ